MDNFLSWEPKDVLVNHGPTKLLVNKYHWHSPMVGMVASYTPTERDVEGHFDVFRGVDQIEAFAQATTGSLSIFLESEKHNCSPFELTKILIPRFVSIGQVIFHNYLKKGDTFISIGHITFYKFRQMACDGRIYKAPKGLDLDDYFTQFTEERLLAYDISEDFTLVASLNDVTGRSIKKELFEKQAQQ